MSQAAPALFDLLGRRWALNVIWELRNGPLTFRALQVATGGASPSVLNTRLAELREAGIVEDGYALTKYGVQLAEALGPVEDWAKRWARRTSR